MRKNPIIAFASLLVLALQAISNAAAETTVANDRMTKAQARERLAACGAEWQRMKRNGADGALIWREFSPVCMARQARPSADKPGADKPGVRASGTAGDKAERR